MLFFYGDIKMYEDDFMLLESQMEILLKKYFLLYDFI